MEHIIECNKFIIQVLIHLYFKKALAVVQPSCFTPFETFASFDKLVAPLR